MRFGDTFTFKKTTTSLLLRALGLDIVLSKFLVVDFGYGVNALGNVVYLEGSRTSEFILSFKG